MTLSHAINDTRCLSDHALARLLGEDLPYGDLTTDALGIGKHAAVASFRARFAMTVCAVEEAARLFVLVGAAPTVLCPSGSVVEAGTVVLEVSGSASALHRVYKAAQVMMEWSGGIATAAAAIVAVAAGVPVACTRKNVPGTRALSAKAVKAGGARLHRLGLSESLLIFEEHRLFINESPARTIARLKQLEPEKKIVVEVADEAQAPPDGFVSLCTRGGIVIGAIEPVDGIGVPAPGADAIGIRKIGRAVHQRHARGGIVHHGGAILGAAGEIVRKPECMSDFMDSKLPQPRSRQQDRVVAAAAIVLVGAHQPFKDHLVLPGA